MRLFKKYKQIGVLNMQGKRRGRRCIKKEKGGVGYERKFSKLKWCFIQLYKDIYSDNFTHRFQSKFFHIFDMN